MAGNTVESNNNDTLLNETQAYKPILGNQSDVEVLPAKGLTLREQPQSDTNDSGFVVLPNEYTPLGTGDDTPTMTEVDPKHYTVIDAAVAGFAPTGRDWTNAITEVLNYERDPLYDAQVDYDKFIKTHGVKGRQEMVFLLKAESGEAFQHRAEYLLAQRERDAAIAEHPIVGTLASFADVDTAVAAIPVGGSQAKATRMVQRATSALVGGTGAYQVNDALDERLYRTELEKQMDVFSFALGGAFAITADSSKQIRKGVEAVLNPSTDAKYSIPVGGTGVKINLNPKTDVPFPEGSVENLTMAQLQSAADEMFYYTQGDIKNPLNRLLSSPAYTQGDDVPAHVAAVARDAEFRLAEYEDALERATRQIHGSSPVMGRLFKNVHARNQRDTAKKVFTEMQKIDQRVLEASDIGKHLADEDIIAMIDASDNLDAIKDAMKAYVQSGFATTVYDHVKRVGMLDEDALELILRRPTYMPVNHSYDTIYKFAKGSKENLDAISTFIGRQIAKAHPELLDGSYKLDFKRIGQHFLQTQRSMARNTSSVKTIGIGQQDIVTLLTKQGVPEADAIKNAEVIFKGSSQSTGTAGNLKQRVPWDWYAEGELPDGTKFTMSDLVDGNAMSNLNSYTRRMTHRVGLAHYGFKKVNDLETAIEDALDALPSTVDTQKARKFLTNVRDSALGQAVGEDVPVALRNLSTMSGMLLLAYAGLYNTVDAATQIQKLGLVKSIPHLHKGFKPMFEGMKSFTVSEAKDLESILTGKLMSLDRWRNFTTHYADDFAIDGGFTEGVQYFGQSTRFTNGSEFVKRWQLGVFASIYVDTLGKATKGDPKALQYLSTKLNMSDELIKSVTKEFKTHGNYIDKWDADIRIAMEQKIFHEADNLAFTVHKGEVPSILEYSQVGKVVFPFMRFLFAMQNKLLRRSYVRDGASGVAAVLAVQFPLAYMIAGLKEHLKGRDPSEELDIENAADAAEVARKVMTSMSALGSVAYPLDLILSGGENVGGGTVLAPVTRGISLGADAVSGDITMRDIKEKTPLNTVLGVNLFYSLLADEEED